MRHVIIDGNNYLSIALHKTIAYTQEDNPEKIIMAIKELFLQMCRKLQRNFKETSQYYVVWDHPAGSEWRRQFLSEYKAARKRPAYLKEAIDAGKKVADELMMLNIEVVGAEADDVIYALAKILTGEKVIVSRDRDMIQIIQQGLAQRLWDPVSKVDIRIPDYDVVLYKCLVGDSSDNIPGIKGIGPKRALKILETGIPNNLMEEVSFFKKLIALSDNPQHEQYIQAVKQILEGVFNAIG